MPRPLKWSRDLHAIREHAQTSRTETWSRRDLEDLFNVRRATAQTLARAIGEVETVAGAHFVDRASLIGFLDAMIEAPSVEAAMRARLEEAPAPPQRRPLKVSLPEDLRNARITSLPPTIEITPGALTIRADGMVQLLEHLALLARVLENDFPSVEARFAPQRASDQEITGFLNRLRGGQPDDSPLVTQSKMLDDH